MPTCILHHFPYGYGGPKISYAIGRIEGFFTQSIHMLANSAVPLANTAM
jgi:hypothetical protein